MKKLIASIVILSISGFTLCAQNPKDYELESILNNITGPPDWSAINEKLLSKYSQHKTDSIILAAKIEFYWKTKNYEQYIKEYIRSAQISNLAPDPASKNAVSWRIFEYASDNGDLSIAESWISKAQNAEPMNAYYLDTWANILYKSGELKKAEEIQMWAAWIGRMEPVFIANLFKMKAKIPTWKYPVVEQKLQRSKKSEDTVWLAIQRKFNRTTDSLIWQSRLRESRSYPHKSDYASTILQYVEDFNPVRSSHNLNEYAWEIFQYSTNKAELKKAIAWSNESLKDPQMSSSHYAYLDTNANLLYKLGRKREAIATQQRALALAPESEKSAYEATLTKMKQGLPTWP